MISVVHWLYCIVTDQNFWVYKFTHSASAN